MCLALGNLRVALLSYATTEPKSRIYTITESRWSDFYTALDHLLEECVAQQGVGGAYLLPRSSATRRAVDLNTNEGSEPWHDTIKPSCLCL